MIDKFHSTPVLHNTCEKGEGPTIIKLILDAGGEYLVTMMIMKEGE